MARLIHITPPTIPLQHACGGYPTSTRLAERLCSCRVTQVINLKKLLLIAIINHRDNSAYCFTLAQNAGDYPLPST